MALKTQQNLVQPVANPEPSVPPMRTRRAQAVHRLQIGLFGLAAMLLLVGLANIIMDRARLAEVEEGSVPAVAMSEGAETARDPLADIGVVPAADPSASGVKAKK